MCVSRRVRVMPTTPKRLEIVVCARLSAHERSEILNSLQLGNHSRRGARMPVRESDRALLDVRGRPGAGRRRPRATRAGALSGSPTLDVLQAKIRPPMLRAGVLARPALVNRVRRSGARVVPIVAPAGWGKTTLVVQWADADPRPVVWISLDARDNDAEALLKHVVAAIRRVAPVDQRLLASLSCPRRPALPVALSRTAKVLRGSPHALLIAIDNADLLHASDAKRVILMLVSEAPPGSTIALLSRTPPRLVSGALEKQGSAHEVTIGDLALGDKDAEQMLRQENAELSADETAELVERCEGWPAALYLASLAVGDAGATTPRSHLDGSDRYLADYMRSEYLSQLRPHELQFVRRTSILEELTVPLCNAVLQTSDAAVHIRRLARAQLVVTDDARQGRYRYHHLIRDLLSHELATTEPKRVQSLHSRAADWYTANGDPESALPHAEAAGDESRVAALLSAIALPAASSGRILVVERALADFEAARRLGRYPLIAVHGSWVHAFRGRTAAAKRWLAAAERGTRRRGSDAAALRPRIATVNAALCRRGPRQMLADSGSALRRLDPKSQWYAPALHMRACAALLSDAGEEAEALLEATIAAATRSATETRMIALSQLSLLTRENGDADRADVLAEEARELVARLDGYPTTAVALAAAAKAALRHGRWGDARALADGALPHTSFITDALPWLAVSTRLELATTYVALRDAQAAKALADEIDWLLDARPLLGVLADRARTLQYELARRTVAEAPAGLTPAELRLVPFLATHFSFREIADELQISRNTVKTQAISIYRKLGVSGRSEALAAARELGVSISENA
jgi:LuxR family transcriptional regulator, maltose regulon positive regulatory protein